MLQNQPGEMLVIARILIFNMINYHLQFNQVSQQNRKIFSDLAQDYGVFSLIKAQQIADKIAIKEVNQDFNYLLNQVKIAIQTAGYNVDQDALNLIKQALDDPNYMNVSNFLARKYDLSNQLIGSYAVPWLMELHNIYKALQYLKNLPGLSGKPIKIFGNLF